MCARFLNGDGDIFKSGFEVIECVYLVGNTGQTAGQREKRLVGVYQRASRAVEALSAAADAAATAEDLDPPISCYSTCNQSRSMVSMRCLIYRYLK